MTINHGSIFLAGAMLLACSNDSGSDDSGSTGDTGSGSEVTQTGDTGTDAYLFAADPPSAYIRVDRMGMPGINTAVITSKDAYNQGSPADDAAGTFVAEITSNLEALHAAIDDDLTGLGLVPCAASDCVAQAAPLVVPDTLKLDLTMPAGFPNGRPLDGPIMDITLAVVLLDLSVDGQTAATLAGVPVNPPANDVPLPSSFPFLAAPH